MSGCFAGQVGKGHAKMQQGVQKSMPVLSRFYGIVIRMYFQQAEHNPPHIHAVYGEDVAALDIQTGGVIEGQLPPKALALVIEWLALHRAELMEIWNTQSFKQLAPLE
jgi:hypothetical protein